MRAKDALKQALREEFVPALRAAGFKGTYPTWRLQVGDTTAVVTILAGQYNEGTYGTFEGAMSVVTPAWKEWLESEFSGGWYEPRKPGREQYWDGIARLALTPLNRSGGRSGWTIDSVDDAKIVARQMTEALNAGQLANLLRLTDPAELLADLTTITSSPPIRQVPRQRVALGRRLPGCPDRARRPAQRPRWPRVQSRMPTPRAMGQPPPGTHRTDPPRHQRRSVGSRTSRTPEQRGAVEPLSPNHARGASPSENHPFRAATCRPRVGSVSGSEVDLSDSTWVVKA